VAGPVLESVRPAFRAFAATVVLEAALLDSAGWRELESIVDRAVAARPRKVQRQLRLLLRLIEHLPRLRRGRPFTRLSPAERNRFLTGLQDSPVLVLRRGVWGLRTLVFMGYYARQAAAVKIGYRAHPRGWEVRR